MDVLKKVFGGSKHSSSSTSSSGQKDDIGDKGAAYINKNFFGGKLSRDQLEKATDSGRAALEKATGKKVPSQLSN